MCTEDVNNDGIDDLIVGAPMYSLTIDKSSHFIEEVGAVILFLGASGQVTFIFFVKKLTFVKYHHTLVSII